MGLLAVVVVIGASVWLDYDATISRSIVFGEEERFFVNRGDTLSSVIKRLEDQDRIEKSWPFIYYARLHGVGGHIQSGEYRFGEPVGIGEFINSLSTGKDQIQYRVTILEGWTFRQMRETLGRVDELEKITVDWDDGRIMAEIGRPDLHPEGQFYPDTYFFRIGDSDLDLYRAAYELMQKHLDRAWENRNEDLQLKNRGEVLTMASIIEKESQIRDEQPIISGVFDNRLRKGMKLQTDPTVIYGLGEQFNGNLTRKHLRTDTPYNTYTRWGLPPTPICLPGEGALMAAAMPAETTAYYFVAKGGGRHKFSDTLEEHNAAVRKYQLRRK